MKREINKKNFQGFSLLEAIIATAVLTIGILAVIQMFPISMQIRKLSEMKTIASQLAQEKIEEIVLKSFDEISDEATTTLASPFEAFDRAVEVSCFDPNGSEPPDCPDSGIKKVKVTVSWKSPLGISKKTLKIISLVSKR